MSALQWNMCWETYMGCKRMIVGKAGSILSASFAFGVEMV